MKHSKMAVMTLLGIFALTSCSSQKKTAPALKAEWSGVVIWRACESDTPYVTLENGNEKKAALMSRTECEKPMWAKGECLNITADQNKLIDGKVPDYIDVSKPGYSYAPAACAAVSMSTPEPLKAEWSGTVVARSCSSKHHPILKNAKHAFVHLKNGNEPEKGITMSKAECKNPMWAEGSCVKITVTDQSWLKGWAESRYENEVPRAMNMRDEGYAYAPCAK